MYYELYEIFPVCMRYIAIDRGPKSTFRMYELSIEYDVGDAEGTCECLRISVGTMVTVYGYGVLYNVYTTYVGGALPEAHGEWQTSFNITLVHYILLCNRIGGHIYLGIWNNGWCNMDGSIDV